MMGGVCVSNWIEIILKSGKSIDAGLGKVEIKWNKKTGKIAGLRFSDFIICKNTPLFIDPNEIAAIIETRKEWRDAK